MKGHTSNRRPWWATTVAWRGRRKRRSQARKRRSFKFTFPVIRRAAAGSNPFGGTSAAPRAARKTRQRLHATSWRARFKAGFVGVFGSARWISLFLLLGVGSVFYLTGADATFYLTKIQVAGVATLAQEAVVEASGIDGLHIFWIDPVEAAQQVAAMPSVMTATVEIGWPGGRPEARITISERAPVMVWEQAGDRFWVDEGGRLMQARQELARLLLIISDEGDNWYIGDRIPADVLAGALQLRRERPNIGALYYEKSTGLCYQDGRNWRAYFGVGRDMHQKLLIYETLVADLQARDLQPKYISVINKEKPFYLLAEPAE